MFLFPRWDMFFFPGWYISRSHGHLAFAGGRTFTQAKCGNQVFRGFPYGKPKVSSMWILKVCWLYRIILIQTWNESPISHQEIIIQNHPRCCIMMMLYHLVYVFSVVSAWYMKFAKAATGYARPMLIVGMTSLPSRLEGPHSESTDVITRRCTVTTGLSWMHNFGFYFSSDLCHVFIFLLVTTCGCALLFGGSMYGNYGCFLRVGLAAHGMPLKWWTIICWCTPPKMDKCPLSRNHFKREHSPQPSFFKGYVSFRGGVEMKCISVSEVVSSIHWHCSLKESCSEMGSDSIRLDERGHLVPGWLYKQNKRRNKELKKQTERNQETNKPTNQQTTTINRG